MHRNPGPRHEWRHSGQASYDHDTDEPQETRIFEPMEEGGRHLGERRHGHTVQFGLVIAVSTWSSQRPLISRYSAAWPSILNPQRSRTAALRVFRGMELAATRWRFQVSNANA